MQFTHPRWPAITAGAEIQSAPRVSHRLALQAVRTDFTVGLDVLHRQFAAAVLRVRAKLLGVTVGAGVHLR